jgi:hypothetical protein
MITRLWTIGMLVVGACVGAALALPLVTRVETWQVLVAVVAGVLIATVLVRNEDKAEAKPASAPVPVQEPRRPRPNEATTVIAPRAGAPARLVLDAETPSAGGQWWTQTGAKPGPTGNGEAARPATQARDLAGYVETARVVQCPRCGSFHIDVTRLAAGYSFRCRTDEHAWQWQPGRAWPATAVVSRRRIP